MPPAADPIRIVPSSPQAPPSPPSRGRSQIACGEPAPTSVRNNLPALEKAIERPSGDQNGRNPFSVSESSRGVWSSSARIHRLDTDPFHPSNTKLRPSCARAAYGEAWKMPKLRPEGALSSNVVTGGAAVGSERNHDAP